MSSNNQKQKLFAAVSALVGTGTVSERLEAAHVHIVAGSDGEGIDPAAYQNLLDEFKVVDTLPDDAAKVKLAQAVLCVFGDNYK